MLKADPHTAVRNAFLPSFNFIIISRACGSSWSIEKKKTVISVQISQTPNYRAWNLVKTYIHWKQHDLFKNIAIYPFPFSLK